MLRVDQWQLVHQSLVPVIPHFKQVLSQKASQLKKKEKRSKREFCFPQYYQKNKIKRLRDFAFPIKQMTSMAILSLNKITQIPHPLL